MVTKLDFSNKLLAVSANFDGDAVTVDNKNYWTGVATGAAIFNGEDEPVNIDNFTAAGSIAYDRFNHRYYFADGSYLTYKQGNTNVTAVAQGDIDAVIDLDDDDGLTYLPNPNNDGSLGFFVDKNNVKFNLSIDSTGITQLEEEEIKTSSKNFSLTCGAITTDSIPVTFNIQGDGVNNISAEVDGDSEIELISNGNIISNINVGGTPFNNVTFSGELNFDPFDSTVSFSKGSALGVDIGTRHIDFMTTNTAGGELSFTPYGVNFEPEDDDAGLIMTVTENGQPRMTVLKPGGEINYIIDGSTVLDAGTTVTNTFTNGSALAIASSTDGSSIIRSTEGGLQVTSANPAAVTATFATQANNSVMTEIKLVGTVTYNDGGFILSDGSSLSYEFNDPNISNQAEILSATSGDAVIYSNTNIDTVFATTGQLILEQFFQTYAINHGSLTLISGGFAQVSAGTDLAASVARSFVLEDIGDYMINGTYIKNNVAGSALISNTDGSIVYNGVNYAAGNFAIDAAGNGIGIVTSADLAGDFLPNYNDDFANALILTDAATFDAQLSDILPVNDTPRLGEISFQTELDKLAEPQIVIPNDN